MHRALPKLRTLVTLALMTGVVSMVAATAIDDQRSIRGGEARAVAGAAGSKARVDPAIGAKGTTGTGTDTGIGTDTEPEAIALTIAPRRDGTLRFDLDRLAELRIGAVVEISLGDAGVDRYEVLDARRERGSDRWWRLASIDHADGVGTLAASGRMLAGWLQSPAFGGDFEWSLRPAGPGRLQPMPKPADAVGCGGGIEPPAHLLEPEANRGMGPFEERGRAPIARLGDDEIDEECAGCSSGVAGATVAAPALAQNAVITMHLDFWAGEHAMLTSGSAGYVSTFVTSSGYLALYSGGSIVSGTSFGLWNPLASSPYTSGYRWDIGITGAGNYGVILTDAYGDGWAWASASGADAYVASGDVAGGSATIGFSSGSFASGSFTVTPAPGALALLGLAGLAGRRKRA